MSEEPGLRPPDDVSETVRRALAEDVGSGDITASLVPPRTNARATVICREPAVLCGSAWFEEVFKHLDSGIRIAWHKRDGDPLDVDDTVCIVAGPAAPILTGERTALNFLQLLSATATVASRFAAAVAGTAVRLLDTRKTIPGLRSAQKYAVRCGGCFNHRMGLYDAVLIKENHIASAGSIGDAVAAVKRHHPSVTVEVEVEGLEELEAALAAGVDIVMLDNFDLASIVEAVTRTDGRARLEVSGNVALERMAELARTGVDFISVGALTKDVRAIDFSMRFEV